VSTAVPATFKGIEVARSANVTFDDLAFRGKVQDDWGTGVGLKITNSRNVRIEDSEF
jgi:hypothetical protein